MADHARAPVRSPSAAIVLGTLSGFLAGFLYMAISIPLVVVTVGQEELNAVSQSLYAAETIARWMEGGIVLSPQRANQLGVSAAHVRIPETDTVVYSLGELNTEALATAVCDDPTPRLLDFEGETWAVSCIQTPTHQIATAVLPTYRVASQIVYWTFILAVVVGIVTALMQARLLRPLTEMARAVERVGRGERNVQVQSTGLAELDVMVDRINEAADNVEERVDAITARITVVQEMARMVAHEVRNPLQSLELLTSLVAREESAEERKEIARSIHSEIRNLDQVVHRLLREGASTGALRLKRKRQSVAVLVEQVTRLRQAEVQRKGVRLSVGVLSEDKLYVDGAMLSRSIENLVSNALQAVSKGTGEIRLSVFRDGSSLKIVVDDNGPGVSPELGQTIFDPDVTGRETGTGLGLALVRSVMVAHGGTIEYSTSPLGGARFVATLPVDPSESPHE